MWPERKSVGLMKDMVPKLSKPGQLALEAFAGTLPGAKACLLLDKHRTLAGCDKIFICLQKSMSSLVEVYASKFLNVRSDLTDDDCPKYSVPVYLAALKSGRLREFLNSWDSPPGLPSTQKFRKPVFLYLCAFAPALPRA